MQKFYPLFVVLALSTRLEAQTPVDREPHHKVIMENSYFRLLEGNIPAGDTTPAHLHAANSVVVFLSHSIFGLQTIGDKPTITTVNPGDLRYAAYGDKPVNHIVWNQTPSVFHFYVVELAKKAIGQDSCAVQSQPGVILQIQQPQVKVYSLEIANDHPLHLEPASCARLLIDITGTISAAGATSGSLSATGATTLSPMQYKFFAPKTPIDLKGDAHCILLEMN